MLDEIKSLVEFVNKCKVQHLEIFTREDFSSRKSKMGILFEEIKTKQFENKEDLKNALYGNSSLGYGFEKIFTRFQERSNWDLPFAQGLGYNQRTKGIKPPNGQKMR